MVDGAGECAPRKLSRGERNCGVLIKSLRESHWCPPVYSHADDRTLERFDQWKGVGDPNDRHTRRHLGETRELGR